MKNHFVSVTFFVSCTLLSNFKRTSGFRFGEFGNVMGQVIFDHVLPKSMGNLIQLQPLSNNVLSTLDEKGFDFTNEEIEKLKLWPNGEIPFYIDNFSFGKQIRDKIRDILTAVNVIGNVRFTELFTPPDDEKKRWVFFINRRAILNCVDHDLRKFPTAGVVKIILGYDCLEYGNLASTVLAIVGVPPMHNAPDRDKYITVNEDNIIEDKKDSFKKFEDNEWLFHELEYDFSSAGHFDFHRHTANGRATIEPKQVEKMRKETSANAVGEASFFSYADIKKIQMLYNYISKPKNAKSAVQCSKLFIPGKNSAKPVEEDDKIEPRPKPGKYMGQTNNDSNADDKTGPTDPDDPGNKPSDKTTDNVDLANPITDFSSEGKEKFDVKLTGFNTKLKFLSDDFTDEDDNK